MKVWIQKSQLDQIEADKYDVHQWLHVMKYKPVYNDAIEIEIIVCGEVS